jgi:hypothetical protein
MTKYTLLTELCCKKEKMLLPSTDKNSYNHDNICGDPHLPVNHTGKTCMFQQKHTFMKVTNKMQLYRLIYYSKSALRVFRAKFSPIIGSTWL